MSPTVFRGAGRIELHLEVEAPVRPSEDGEKVKRAMLNLFPDLVLRLEGDRLVGESGSVAKFGDLLRRFRIRDAARGRLIHGKRDDRCTVFRLSKQAAFMERVSFSDREAPLGDIRVRLEDDRLDQVIDMVAPDTRPRSMRLADERKALARSEAGRQKPHTRQKLDPHEDWGKDPLEED